MPLSLDQLKPGDPVVLNCQKARFQGRRKVHFNGIKTAEEIIGEMADRGARMSRGASELLIPEARYAIFSELAIAGPGERLRFCHADGSREDLDSPVVALTMCFLITEDGLEDAEGRRVFIERRLHEDN